MNLEWITKSITSTLKGEEEENVSPTLSAKEINNEAIVKGWCSWCFKKTAHGLIQKNYIDRNVYKCTDCSKRTLCCRWTVTDCDGMAKGHVDESGLTWWDDELCAVCDGAISDWEGASEPASYGYCSWCYLETKHVHLQGNYIRPDIFNCCSCLNNTLPCQYEDCEAFARSTFVPSMYCELHSGEIKNWLDQESNQNKAMKRGSLHKPKEDPLKSFAPWRFAINVKALVDAKEFFNEVADALEMANDEIFISFWQFHVFLNLKREDITDHWTIENILRRKAEQGVRIYILLWDETDICTNNFSKEAQTSLEALHFNINVVRHPSYTPLIWTHHQKFIVIDQKIGIVGGLDICLGRYDDPSHPLLDEDQRTWVGVDYYNPHYAKPQDISNPLLNVIDRTEIPRMPWHDISVRIDGECARDLALNFIQRWNHHSADDDNAPILTLRRSLDQQFKETRSFKDIDRVCSLENLNKVSRAEAALPQSYKSDDLAPSESSGNGNKTGTCTARIIRSLSEWSGSTRKEQSIYGAYLYVLEQAQHYIYIENQYLSSSLAGGGVENKLMAAIMKKIEEKIAKNEDFRVYVVLSHPETVGEELKGILRWQLQTINKGGLSILEQLREKYDESVIERYITFYLLRTHAMLNGIPVTEKVFVHSKIMIVDDEYCIISSANLNDRSMLGDRDSELGVLIVDTHKVDSMMNGKKVEVGSFPRDLRLRLWKEHLGITSTDQIQDPVCDNTYFGIWFSRAKANTRIYESVFPSVPSNKMRTWEEYEKCLKLHPVKPYEALDDVFGFVTFLPLDFLLDESMNTTLEVVLGPSLFQ